MATPLWQPTAEQLNQSNMIDYIRFIEGEFGVAFEDYGQFHRWSVDRAADFWASIWHYSDIIASEPWQEVLEDADRFPGARWFTGARLNFAENLLRFAQQPAYRDKAALISRLENGERYSLSYADLHREVEKLAAGLRQVGVAPGDRVAAFMPNVAETVIAMLAATSLGAIWSSCSPDFGINGVMDRFGQIEPKVLFACDGYYYNGKTIDSLPRVREIADQISAIEKLVIVPIVNRNKPVELDITDIGNATLLDELKVEAPPPLNFAQLPFDHPVYIMSLSVSPRAPS